MRLGHAIAHDTLDDVLLVVSELVTNAVLHGRGDIRLHVAFDGQTITGEVCDGGRGFAHASPTRASTSIGGNGLHLGETVTRRWGVAEGSSRVWFEIPNRALATAGA